MADQVKANGPYDEFSDVPFTSMTTNQISGGIAVNTIPELCEFNYEFRNLPGMSAQSIQAKVESYVRDELLPRMQREFADARIDMKPAPTPRRWRRANKLRSRPWCVR